jgi:hypothetical protein
MNNSLILLVSIIYLYVGTQLCIEKQYGLGLSFICYSLANIGLFLASRGI